MSGENSVPIGAARLDLIVDGSQLDVAIAAAKSRYSDFSQAGQQALAGLSAAQKRQVDSLLKQADTIGFNKQQMIAYNAVVKGIPVEIVEDLKNRLAATSAAATDAGQSIKGVGDSLKSVTLGDAQLYKANQALAAYKQEAIDTAAAVRTALSAADEDSARYKALAKAGAEYGTAGASTGPRMTADEVAAKQAQIKALNEAAAARDKERRATQEAADAQKQATAAAQAEQQALQKLLNEINPVNKALERLDTLESQLRAARSKGTISQDDYVAYAAKIDKSRVAITKADEAVGHFALNTSGARRELGVMVGELLQGNFSNFEGSIATLANRTGLLATMLTPIGLLATAAAVGIIGLGAGAVAGAREIDLLNKAVVSTGGYANNSTAALDQMASSVGRSTGQWSESRKAIEQLAASGKVAGAGIAGLAQGAVDMSIVTGESIDKAVAKILEIGDSPAAAIAKLNDQYHFLTAAQYAHIAALEEEGRTQDAARIAQQALNSAMASRAQEVEDNAGWIVKSAHWVRDAWGEAWDAVKNVGKPSDMADQVKAIQNQIEQLKQGRYLPNGNYQQGVADTDPRVVALQNQLANLRKQQWEAGLADASKADEAAANQAAIAAQRRLAAFASPKDKLDSELKKASADRLAAMYGVVDKSELGRIEAQYETQVRRARDAYAAAMKKQDGGAGKADESAQVQAFKANLASLNDGYRNSQAELDAARRAGSVSDADYYEQSQNLLWKNEADQVTAIQAEIDRLKTRKAIGAERIRLDGQVAQLTAQAAKVEADALSKSDQLAQQADATYKKRQQAIDSYRLALDKANDSLQAQVNAEIARIGMGDRQFQLQQGINKALEDQAAKMEELALKRQAGVNGGGIDEDQYNADVAALQAATDRRVAIIRDGYRRQTEAEADWRNGVNRGLENWVEQAQNAAGQVASFTDSTLGGAVDLLTDRLTSRKQSIRDFVKDVLTQLAKIELRVEASKALSSLLGAVTGGTSGAGDALNGGANYAGAGSLSTNWAGQGGGWTFNAKGGTYESPSLSAYSGQIVDRPTPFAFAKGAGIMGEAGPEGILPLTRTAGGQLGVRSVGAGGGVNVAVEVNIESDGSSQVTQRGDADALGRDIGNQMAAVAERVVARALQPGGSIWRARN